MTTMLMFSLEAWDGIWRRNQYLVDGLLRADASLRVVFVEPAVDVVHEARSGRRVRRGAGWRIGEGYRGRLALFQPTKWMPRLAGPFADASLRGQVRGAVQKAGWWPDIVWINDPGWAEFDPTLSAPVVYDVTDDWTAADRPERERERTVRHHDRLLRESDAVIVCSPHLQRAAQTVRERAHLISNAVEVSRYRTPAARPADLPPAPVAVYVGTLHEDRLDVALAARTARAMAAIGGSAALVGPDVLSETSRGRLTSTPGLHMLGPKAYTEVPAYLQHATVLIVPHVVDAFTDSLDPIKLYEYRAVGRPVVSTPVAGFRDLAGSQGIEVRDAAAFPEAVVGAARADAATVPFDDVPDWADRVAAAREVLHDVQLCWGANNPPSNGTM